MKLLICWVETIYALTDPRTDEVRYIGRTSKLWQRYDNHRNPLTKDLTPKALWLKELRSLGLYPGLIELETLPFTFTMTTKPLFTPVELERYWIQSFKMLGANLTNVVHNTQIAGKTKLRKAA